MQLKPSRREIKTIDLLPLINVVFLLILFVLIAGRPTTNHPGEIQVAETDRETAYQGAPFTVHLRADDLFYLPGGGQVTLGEVSEKVTTLKLAEQGLAVELLADRRAHAKPLLEFRRAMAKAGIGEIRMKTQFSAAETGAQ
jgi:biopolymer transport protein ExbD